LSRLTQIDPSDIPDRRIVAEVSAKIPCPEYNLFYSIFGDVVEFFQKTSGGETFGLCIQGFASVL